MIGMPSLTPSRLLRRHPAPFKGAGMGFGFSDVLFIIDLTSKEL